jgi:hypothetical protein
MKIRAAEFYRDARQKILDRICKGGLVHADETRIHLQGTSGYVWVLTNLHEVVYSIQKHGKASCRNHSCTTSMACWSRILFCTIQSTANNRNAFVHLIRDLNDEVLDHPYDEELKSIVRSFGSLLKLNVCRGVIS